MAYSLALSKSLHLYIITATPHPVLFLSLRFSIILSIFLFSLFRFAFHFFLRLAIFRYFYFPFILKVSFPPPLSCLLARCLLLTRDYRLFLTLLSFVDLTSIRLDVISIASGQFNLFYSFSPFLFILFPLKHISGINNYNSFCFNSFSVRIHRLMILPDMTLHEFYILRSSGCCCLMNLSYLIVMRTK